MDQNFSWIEQTGHRLDQQEVRRQRAGVIGLTTSGRKAWQEDEETRKDFSIELILQE